jgi:hypothetical protein
MIQRKEAHETDQKFPLTTIDKLVAELKLPKVDFIKMDIEGAEVKALNGARETIAEVSSTNGAERLPCARSSGGGAQGCKGRVVRVHDGVRAVCGCAWTHSAGHSVLLLARRRRSAIRISPRGSKHFQVHHSSIIPGEE